MKFDEPNKKKKLKYFFCFFSFLVLIVNCYSLGSELKTTKETAESKSGFDSSINKLKLSIKLHKNKELKVKTSSFEKNEKANTETERRKFERRQEEYSEVDKLDKLDNQNQAFLENEDLIINDYAAITKSNNKFLLWNSELPK